MAIPVTSLSTTTVYRSQGPLPREISFELIIQAILPRPSSTCMIATITVDINRVSNEIVVTVFTRSIPLPQGGG